MTHSETDLDRSFAEIVQLNGENHDVFTWLSATSAAPDYAVQDLKDELADFHVLSWVGLPAVLLDEDMNLTEETEDYSTSLMHIAILAISDQKPNTGFLILWEGAKLQAEEDTTFEVKILRLPLARIITVSTSSFTQEDQSTITFRGLQLSVEYEGVVSDLDFGSYIDPEQVEGGSLPLITVHSNKIVIADEDVHSDSTATADLKVFARKLCQAVL